MNTTDYALYFKGDLILANHQEDYLFPLNHLKGQESIFIGPFKGKNIHAVSFPNDHQHLKPIRDFLAAADQKTAQLISSGKQLLHWHQNSKYSGCCGAPTEMSSKEIAKICPKCNKVMYPSTHPVIIVSIEHEDRILLARSPHFAKGMYSALAGYIEAGETCEAAIIREVYEEVGIRVKDAAYFGSQPWPFPNSFILGYIAKYDEGEITIDQHEIEDAQWFDVSNLPELPSKCSIARQMIDDYIARQKALEGELRSLL